MVGQRKTASPDQVEFDQLPGSDRKLIIDVIGGHLERDSVEALKGTDGEKIEKIVIDPLVGMADFLLWILQMSPGIARF